MQWRTISIIIIAVIAVIWLFHYFFMSLWFRSVVSGVWVNPFRLIQMRMQRIDPREIILPMITAVQAGLVNISISRLVAHHLAKGSVEKILKALIIARKGGVPIDFGIATATDLAGFDVIQFVQSYITPRVIKTPKVTAVAKDGIELIVTTKVTIQTKFDLLVGGAGEETIIAIVSEEIVAAIGNAESHKDIKAHPDIVSNKIVKKFQEPEKLKILAYNVISVDFESIESGRNVGVEHSIRKAEAEKKIAQSNAEKAEQEMKVRLLEKRAALLDAEAQVPLAISAAIREGKVNLMDYYRMKNMIADTKMRDSFASSDEPTLEELLDDDDAQDIYKDQKKKP